MFLEPPKEQKVKFASGRPARLKRKPVLLHDQLLLEEMRRQIKNDDEEIKELKDYKNDLDLFKADPVAINKKMLQNFNKDHPLFKDRHYMHKIIKNMSNRMKVKNLKIKVV